MSRASKTSSKSSARAAKAILRTTLADELSIYIVARGRMLTKARTIPNVMEIYEAVSKEMLATMPLHDLNNDWKGFLAEANKVCSEDPEVPKR